jgi:hypothetical protein
MKRLSRKKILIWLSISVLLWIQEVKGIDVNEIIRSAQEVYKNQEKHLRNYSCSTHLTVKVIKKSGEVLWEESGEQRIQVKEGEKYTEIISWIKNGKYLSSKELKKKEEGINKDIKEGAKEVSYWPFKPGMEKYYEYRLLGEVKINGYTTHRISAIPWNKDKEREFYEGDFWLDINTYGVVKAIYSTNKLPKFHKKMNTEVNYEQIQPGIWLPSSKSVKSEISAIVYKLDSEMKITYSDYKLNHDFKKHKK